MIIKTFQIEQDDDGQRLDRWLKKNCPHVPFSLLQKLLRTGQVRVDGKRAKMDQKLLSGQSLRIPLQDVIPDLQAGVLSDSDYKLAKSIVLYEDDDLIVINKPSGLATQGGSGVTRHVDGLLAAFSKNPKKKPKLVHRLDRETSGVLVAAKSTTMATALGDLFAGRTIRKVYLALTSPPPAVPRGRIEAKLKKGTAGRNMEKMLVSDDGQDALTHYQQIDAKDSVALVAFAPRTGRTHQIRVHSAHIGAPLVGDEKYGGSKASRVCLHAALLEFVHPRLDKKMTFIAPVPDDMMKLAEKAGLRLPTNTDLSQIFRRDR